MVYNAQNYFTWRLTPSNGPNRVGASLLSPEDRNRSIFQNFVFSSYFEFRMTDKVHNPSDFNFYRVFHFI
jgi:hypothetical protein